MKCGKCRTEFVEGTETRHGVVVRTFTCPKCGKKLEDFEDAVRAKKAALSGKGG